MPLGVERPDPPELQAMDPNEYEDAEVVGDTDYRRDELETFLQEGAWEEAWEIWTRDTDLTEEEWAIVEDLGLIDRFDFFWDSFAGRVGYHAPGIPEDWRERDLHGDLDTWGAVSGINASLTELGQIVCDVLKDEYVDWEADFQAPDDLPEFE